MMKKTSLVIGTILAVTCIPAFAADNNGLYIGADVGSSGYTTGTGAKTGTAYGITGGYQFSQYFGVEAQYTNLGNFSGVSTTTGAAFSSTSDAESLVAIGKLPIADIFSLYGKLGAANTNNNQNHSNGTSGNTSRLDATYGLGVQYEITSAIGARFGWDRYLVDSSSTTTGQTSTRNTDVWALGAVYKF